jgi:Protein of unknown function (DUF3617)
VTPARLLIAATALAAASGLAQAQKIAPGLWEHTITMKMQGGEMEAGMKRMQEQLASLPPEKRKQIEEMMARQGQGGPGLAAGMSMMAGKPTAVKVCITPEQAAREPFTSGQGNCKQISNSQSGKTSKIKFSCTRDDGATMTGDGEFTLISDKEHTGRMVMDGVGRKGQPAHMEIDQAGRWLGADCGDVKPRQAPPVPAKK